MISFVSFEISDLFRNKLRNGEFRDGSVFNSSNSKFQALIGKSQVQVQK